MKITVTPYVGVWIETNANAKMVTITLSHPTWVCGLKPPRGQQETMQGLSHPTWVCGLKPNGKGNR